MVAQKQSHRLAVNSAPCYLRFARMIHSYWRPLIGPLITLASVIAIHAVNHSLYAIPSPLALPLFSVVFSAAMGGIAPGLVSAFISLGAAPTSLSAAGLPLQLNSNDLVQLAVMAVTAPASAVIIGLIRARAIQTMQQLQAMRFAAQGSHRELIALRAGLDRIEVGTVLLDQWRNVQFVNRAFRRIWRVPEELCDAKPTFARLLMFHGRNGEGGAVPSAQFDACIQAQLDLIRTGDEQPLDVRFANGEVFRFGCKALPDGGRFLSYGNVTDLIRHTDTLEEIASIDGLTRLHNRRHFLHLAETEWARFRRYGRTFAMLVVDIDRFKSINDKYGHDIGDRALVEVAHILRSRKRTSDIVARLGGEEFVLLLPEMSLDSACAAADRMRRAVAETSIIVEDGTISVTISVGVSITHEGMDGISQLLKEADVALYDAKHTGRNRVCAFGRAKSEAGEARVSDIRPVVSVMRPAVKTA
jgi:diguanylate cyclase (GGDEF)-like protein